MKVEINSDWIIAWMMISYYFGECWAFVGLSLADLDGILQNPGFSYPLDPLSMLLTYAMETTSFSSMI